MVNSSWKDLDTHGRRLVKIIRILEAKIPKTRDDIDGLSRLSATIGNLTKQTVELIKLVDSYDEITSWFRTIHQDEIVIKKHNIREQKKNIQRDKIEMQNQIHREIEEEKSVKRQAERMKKSGELRL